MDAIGVNPPGPCRRPRASVNPIKDSSTRGAAVRRLSPKRLARKPHPASCQVSGRLAQLDCATMIASMALAKSAAFPACLPLLLHGSRHCPGGAWSLSGCRL